MIGVLLATGASVTAGLLFVEVAVLPLIFKYSKAVQRKMVFSNCINYPRNLDYDNPSSVNIVGGRNFSIQILSKVDKCNIKIGVWHIVPCSMFRDVFVMQNYLKLDERLQAELGKTKNTIVLYCHGNSNHRASPHRLALYKVFQDLDFHVITFDYRGYGDSTRVRPTEAGVVEDVLSVYDWLLRSVAPAQKPTIVFWGHSLGTAVAANVVAHMAQLCKQTGLPTLPLPDALVLEAPFNNLMEEIAMHPFSKIVSWLPYFKETFVKPFSVSSEYAFTTDQYLVKEPQIPILILHSKGDRIVPYELAVKLHDAILSSRQKGGAPVVLHAFERGHRLGHNNLCEAVDLRRVVTDFVEMVKTLSALSTHTNSLTNENLHNIIPDAVIPKIHASVVSLQHNKADIQRILVNIQHSLTNIAGDKPKNIEADATKMVSNGRNAQQDKESAIPTDVRKKGEAKIPLDSECPQLGKANIQSENKKEPDVAKRLLNAEKDLDVLKMMLDKTRIETNVAKMVPGKTKTEPEVAEMVFDERTKTDKAKVVLDAGNIKTNGTKKPEVLIPSLRHLITKISFTKVKPDSSVNNGIVKTQLDLPNIEISDMPDVTKEELDTAKIPNVYRREGL